MLANVIKAQKIAVGISDLFTAMDKGFAKVESDLGLLKRFREICFEANQKLGASIPALTNHVIKLNELILSDKQEETQQIYLEAFKQLLFMREIIADNILMISDYIDDFKVVWEKSFSINALIKFRLLLGEEYLLLEDEIKVIEMGLILDDRVKALKEFSLLQKTLRVPGLSTKSTLEK